MNEENKEPDTVNSIFDGTYFKIISTSNIVNKKNNLVLKTTVKCVNCKDEKDGILTMSDSATHNLYWHLEKSHGKNFSEEARHYRKRKRFNNEPVVENHSFSSNSSSSSSFPQEVISLFHKDLNDLMKCVIGNFLAFSIVENEEFCKLFFHFVAKVDQPMISRTTLVRDIITQFHSTEDFFREKFRTIEYISVTVDFWSHQNTNFIGYTAHWLVPETFQRESVVLCCKPFTKPHTYDNIATDIKRVLNRFEIFEKIEGITTDNASNFKKSFLMFGINQYVIEEVDKVFFVNDELNLDADPELVENFLNAEAEFIYIESQINNEFDLEQNCTTLAGNQLFNSLPLHVKCLCHSLNLVGCTQ